MRRIVGAAACLAAALGIAAVSAGTATAGVRITGSGNATDWSSPADADPGSSIFGTDSTQTGGVVLGRDL